MYLLLSVCKRQRNRQGKYDYWEKYHNQRIERLWRDIFDEVLKLYYDLFYFCEDIGMPDVLNDVHVQSLDYVFLPVVNKKLEIWYGTWCCHRMRTVTATPVQLWLSGHYQHPCGINLNTSEMGFYGSAGDFSREDDEESRPAHIVQAVENELRLIRDEQINSTLYTENSGIEAYRAAFEIISKHI